MKQSLFKILVMTTIIVILVSCGRDGDEVSRSQAELVSHTFSSAEDAFNTMLNSDDRNVRYTATLYLKQQTDSHNDTIKGYGNILFEVHHEHIRKRVYESLGWFGGDTATSLLAVYLVSEEKLPIKTEIVRALGEVGSSAKSTLPTIQRISAQYTRLAEEFSGGGKIIVQDRSGNQRAEYDPSNKKTVKIFQQVAEQAMDKIRR